MYNFWRWFPRGKIIFMAPTKPLVIQQVESCYRVSGPLSACQAAYQLPEPSALHCLVN